jgi:hypothetical protein
MLRHCHDAVTLLFLPLLPPLPRCRSRHQAATAVQLPSCRRQAAVTTATTVALLQCFHRGHCHRYNASAATTKLLLPRC